MDRKTCTKCNEEKSFKDFSKKRGRPQATCKICHNAYYKQYYLDNPDKYEALKERTRDSPARAKSRAKFYGLSVEEMEVLRESNDGLCHICEEATATCIDHDHKTGAVRGHLCIGCNTGLGKFGDSVEGLEKAIAYLQANPKINQTR